MVQECGVGGQPGGRAWRGGGGGQRGGAAGGPRGVAGGDRQVFNDPEFLAAESQVAKSMQVPWALRGPRQGPGEGGPTTWRGSTWRPTTKKWVKRGGRNLKYWSQLYSQHGAKGKGVGKDASGSQDASKGSSSSSSWTPSAAWTPNPKGKGRSNDDWDARGRARAGK